MARAKQQKNFWIDFGKSGLSLELAVALRRYIDRNALFTTWQYGSSIDFGDVSMAGLTNFLSITRAKILSPFLHRRNATFILYNPRPFPNPSPQYPQSLSPITNLLSPITNSLLPPPPLPLPPHSFPPFAPPPPQPPNPHTPNHHPNHRPHPH